MLLCSCEWSWYWISRCMIMVPRKMMTTFRLESSLPRYSSLVSSKKGKCFFSFFSSRGTRNAKVNPVVELIQSLTPGQVPSLTYTLNSRECGRESRFGSQRFLKKLIFVFTSLMTGSDICSLDSSLEMQSEFPDSFLLLFDLLPLLDFISVTDNHLTCNFVEREASATKTLFLYSSYLKSTRKRFESTTHIIRMTDTTKSQRNFDVKSTGMSVSLKPEATESVDWIFGNKKE